MGGDSPILRLTGTPRDDPLCGGLVNRCGIYVPHTPSRKFYQERGGGGQEKGKGFQTRNLQPVDASRFYAVDKGQNAFYHTVRSTNKKYRSNGI